MARGTCTFRQRDLTAAVRAMLKAGVAIARVEIDPNGRIVLVTGQAGQSAAANDLDRELADFEARNAG